MSIFIGKNAGARRAKNIAQSIAVVIGLMTLGACTQVKLKDSISYESYAKCSATYEKSKDVASGTTRLKSLALASIYSNKAASLSSKEAATQKVNEATADYDKLQKKSGEKAYLDALIKDIEKCNTYIAN